VSGVCCVLVEAEVCGCVCVSMGVCLCVCASVEVTAHNNIARTRKNIRAYKIFSLFHLRA
jgi:hypothetical protein